MNQPGISCTQAADFPGGVTVLMAVYGKDDIGLFVRAVQSVYSNTLRPDFFLLVVDGPIPEPMRAAIVHQQREFGIEVLFLPSNIGLAGALNMGLKEIRTQWVVRADADDFNLSDRFARMAAAIGESESSVDLIGGAIQEVEPDGKPIAVRRSVESHAEIVRYAAHRNPFNHMTVAYRTELVLRCGGYPDIHLKEDYALWAQMLAFGAQTVNLPDILVIATTGRDMYRRRGGLRYAHAEILLQRHLVRTGLKTPTMAVIQGIARAIVFLLPPIVRAWIYENVLRQKPS